MLHLATPVSTAFNETVGTLYPSKDLLGRRGSQALQYLAERDYVVLPGLTTDFAGAVGTMAAQEHTASFGWDDSAGEHFATLETTEKWLGENGGRNMFVLARNLGEGSLHLAGYGATWREKSDYVPDGKTTLAVCAGQGDTGKILALPLTQVIVSATANLYRLDSIWTEVWESDDPALQACQGAGFEVAERIRDKRQLSLDESVPEVLDTRVLMTMPNDLLLDYE